MVTTGQERMEEGARLTVMMSAGGAGATPHDDVSTTRHNNVEAAYRKSEGFKGLLQNDCLLVGYIWTRNNDKLNSA